MIDLIDWLCLEIRFFDAERDLFVDFFALRQKMVAAKLSEEAWDALLVAFCSRFDSFRQSTLFPRKQL